MLDLNCSHKYVHNLQLYKSKPSVADNKLPNNIKQIGYNNQFKKQLKNLLIDDIIQLKATSMKNSEIFYTDKQICRISYISNNLISLSLFLILLLFYF
jgi:hypothetical protein